MAKGNKVSTGSPDIMALAEEPPKNKAHPNNAATFPAFSGKSVVALAALLGNTSAKPNCIIIIGISTINK